MSESDENDVVAELEEWVTSLGTHFGAARAVLIAGKVRLAAAEIERLRAEVARRDRVISGAVAGLIAEMSALDCGRAAIEPVVAAARDARAGGEADRLRAERDSLASALVNLIVETEGLEIVTADDQAHLDRAVARGRAAIQQVVDFHLITEAEAAETKGEG